MTKWGSRKRAAIAHAYCSRAPKSKLKALTRQDPSLYRQTLRKDPFLDNKTNDKPDLPITKAPITPPPKKTPPSKPNHCSQPDSSSA